MSRMQLINASAGSGKTYTLARRYIEELLFVVEFNGTVTDAKAQYIIKALRPERDYYQHILAITFTNKATNEMKRRIVDELHTLAQNPLKSNFYTKEWKERLPHDISADDLRHAAAAALAAILFNYSEFRVSTIDSFFQSVLRSFARELNRDYDYDLQIDGDYAAAVAAHNFLLSLGNTARRTGNAKAEPEKWVEQYISDRVNDPTAKTSGWNTIFGSNEGSLAKFAAKINDEFFREHIDELKAYLAADKDAGVREFERITSFTRLLKEMANSCRRQYDDRKNDKDFWRDKFVARCKDVGLSLTDFNQRAALAKVYKTGICSESTMTKALNKPEPHKWFSSPTISQSQLDMALGYFGERLKYLSYSDFLKDLTRRLSLVGLMGEIAASLEEYRQETNSVLIADTNELIGRVVDSSDTPFIYERTGTWINSYMLDEFQDTSRKQYSNFKPLLRDTLDSGNPNLVIGDSKQAIYRFRNADPSIFRDEIYRDFARYLMQENLDTNWRSHRNIVYFNNEFTHRMLAYFAGHHTLENTYKPTGNDTDYRQKLSPAKVDKPGGLVRVHFRPSDSSEAFEKGIDVTTSLIDHLLDMHRRFDWKDINILVNTKKDGKVIVDAVIAHNMDNPDSEIPIVSGEMMLLSQSTAVRRVIGMLHFIDLTSYAMAEDATDVPDDKDYDDVKKRVARNRMKKQRQFKVLEDFEREMGNRELDPTVAGDLLETCFDAANAIARHDTQQQMEIYAEDLNKRLPDQNTHTMSLLNIVEHLVRSIGQDERDTENLFLHALLNYVVDFASRRNGGTVREFLQYWEQKKDKLTVPDAGNVDAIQVYTIHKAKGLEAHCVVIPCAGWELDNNPQDKEYWVDAKTWLDCGGRKLLDEVAPGQWNEQMIPPILALGKSAVRNIIRANGLFADIVARKDEELLIDNVNKTYVAFTRPRMELHIYCVGSERNSTTTTNLNHVLKDLIRDSQDHMGFVEKENGAYYDLGNPMPDIDRNVTTPSGNRDRKPNNYTTRPLPPYVVSNSAINVVLPVDEAPGAMMNSEMGSRLHAVMSRLAYAGQLNKVLGYCERRGIITPGEKKSLHDFLADRLSKQPYASWFADDNFVYNERTMLVKDRPSLRPDRIVRHKDGSFSIIDYKFGKYNDEYETQLKGYRNHIAKITGRTARSFLWFINLSSGEDNIIEV